MTEEPRHPAPGSMPPEPPTPPPPGFGQPGYAQPGFTQPDVGQPAYGQPGYTQPDVGQPAYGQPAAKPAGLQGFDAKVVHPMDWAIIAAGLIASVFSAFNYFTYKLQIAGTFSQHFSTSAWHGGLAPIATLLAAFAAVLLAVQVIAKVQLAFPVRLVVLAAFALASLLLLLALFVVPGNTSGFDNFGVTVDKGHGLGYWVSLLAVLTGTALALKRFTDTGGSLPARS